MRALLSHLWKTFLRIVLTEILSLRCLHLHLSMTPSPMLCLPANPILQIYCLQLCMIQQSVFAKAPSDAFSSLFAHTVLQGSWKHLKRGFINNPWILCSCINAAPTYKCKSVVGHCFDTFHGFLALFLAAELWLMTTKGVVKSEGWMER